MDTTFTLSNGNKLPVLGLGTYRATCQEEVNNALKWAVDELGYRNLDTAFFYRNEHQLGEAIKSIKTPRKELFLTTKLWVNQITDEKTIVESVNKALKKLQTDYIDLMLIHWPYTNNPKVNENQDSLHKALYNAWTVFEKLHQQGVLKNIGVSNFLPKELDYLVQNATFPPVVNEIEFHPLLNQSETLTYCKKHHIQVIGYRTIYLHNTMPHFAKVAAQVGKTPVQVLLRWGIQKGVAMIPKSTNQGRLKENSEVFDFSLTDDQMNEIEAQISTNKRYCCDPHSKDSLNTLLELDASE